MPEQVVSTIKGTNNTEEAWELDSTASSDIDEDDSSENLIHREAAVKQKAERATLAHKEHVVVIRMKIVVVAVLLVVSTLVSTGVYLYTRNDQKQDFKDSFQADANRLLESFHKSIERYLEAIDALSVTITSHALETNSTFPFVTLPDFAMRFGNARILSGSPFVQYNPVISDDATRHAWESYVKQNGGKYMEAFATEVAIRAHQDVEFGYRNASVPKPSMPAIPWRSEIFHFGPNNTEVVDAPGTQPYLPLWHFSPALVIPQFLNNNALMYPAIAAAFNETLRTGQAVIDRPVNLKGDEIGAAALFTSLLSQSQYRYVVEEYVLDPTSYLSYPVFDTFDLETRKVVGVIGTMMYYRLFFKNILPPDTRGIHCVLENSKGQSFTYLIDENVTFLGDGDRHDPKYDQYVQVGDWAQYLAKILSLQTKSFTSTDLNTDLCNYQLLVYPSQATENRHVNQDPMKVCLIIVSVFVFTSLVFVLYTMAVNRYQKVVMDRAVASSAIVSSLFPSQVRDQIYHENDADERLTDHGSIANTVAQKRTSLTCSRPIAQLYDNTTIMFADLVGFTKWSSKRQPVQVFELLESLYQAFDTIAMRRNVFKVETIGDCYVAVAGLPEPQDDHAVIMARFAGECMSKMSLLTADLASVLGEDTAKLTMRVGLHSGPVTGGVLRGQKSRFQLFGDSMNTASRMESNGMGGMIHVSQETAHELIAKGKSSWLTPRPDRIVAKGKGELQTFWVYPTSPMRRMSATFNSLDPVEIGGSTTSESMAEL